MKDYDTKNSSFLFVYDQLKKSGIKNNDFFLELNNEKLLNVDPYDNNLSEDTKKAIIKECIDNPWYFFREIFPFNITIYALQIPLLKFNRANIAQLWLSLKYISSWTCTPRQTIKDTTYIAFMTYENLFNINIRINFIGRDKFSAKDGSEKLKRISKTLPAYIANYNKLSNNIINSKSIRNAIKSIKGNSDISYQEYYLNIDSEFIDNIDELINTEQTHAKNNIYKTTIMNSSIPTDPRSKIGKQVLNVLADTVPFSESMYDTSLSDKSFFEKLNDKIVYIHFYADELFDKEHYEKYIDNMKRALCNKEIIDREIYLRRF